MAKTNNIKLKEKYQITYEDIIKDDNPIIREISNKVPYPLDKEDTKIMNQMIEYVRLSQDPTIASEKNLRPAFGISAIQLGYTKMMMYIRIESEYSSKHDEFALVNPELIWSSPTLCYLANGEGCLSVEEDHEGYVLRSFHVKVRGIDYFTEREIEIEAKGMTAVVLQHELDHLLGILYYDRINTLDPLKVPKDALKIVN